MTEMVDSGGGVPNATSIAADPATAAAVPAAPAATAAAVPARPGHVPESLWDAEKGRVRVDDALTALNEYQSGKRAPEGFVRVPGKDAPAEERQAFWQAVGRPETPDGYTFAEAASVDPDRVAAMKPVLHDAGLTQDQVAKLTAADAAYQQQLQKRADDSFAQEIREGTGALHARWREAGADPAQMEAHAVAAYKAFGSPELTKLLQQYGLDTHPLLKSAFAAVGKAAAEGKMVAGDGSGMTQQQQFAAVYPSMAGKYSA